MLDFTERPERTEARAIMHLVCVGAVTLDEARELIVFLNMRRRSFVCSCLSLAKMVFRYGPQLYSVRK